jgi:hypothetical protein
MGGWGGGPTTSPNLCDTTCIASLPMLVCLSSTRPQSCLGRTEPCTGTTLPAPGSAFKTPQVPLLAPLLLYLQVNNRTHHWGRRSIIGQVTGEPQPASHPQHYMSHTEESPFCPHSLIPRHRGSMAHRVFVEEQRKESNSAFVKEEGCGTLTCNQATVLWSGSLTDLLEEAALQ